MNVERKIFINSEFDVVRARMQAREMAKEMGFGMADQARISLAASELARVLVRNVRRNLSELLLVGVMNNGHPGFQVIGTISLSYVQLPNGNGTHWSDTPSPVSRSLAGACQLLDESLVEEQDENLARVILTKWLK
jgi:serine/threonine-protein kinase RsbT